MFVGIVTSSFCANHRGKRTPINMGAAKNRHYVDYKDKKFPSFPRNRVNETVLEEAMVPDPEHLKAGKLVSWNNAVFMDQEATRVIRTDQYSYWKRSKGTGKHELYDIQKDPMQEINLYGNPDCAEAISELGRRLNQFFDTYSNADYDLWKGGTVKGTTESTAVNESLYGEQWRPESVIKLNFRE